MKQITIILIVFFITLITGCKKKEQSFNMDKFNREWQAHVDSVKSTFKEKEDPYNSINIDTIQIDSIRKTKYKFQEKELFIGFKAGMTRNEYKQFYNTLIKKDSLKLFNSNNEYAYHIKTNNKLGIDVQITPIFKNNKLSAVEFLCWNSEPISSFWDIAQYYTDKYGTPYKYKYKYYWFVDNIEIKVREEYISTDPNLSRQFMGVVTITDIRTQK
ncbi:MAG: hypothetical protein ACK5M3_16070 [Dysgonomonas sp.]